MRWRHPYILFAVLTAVLFAAFSFPLKAQDNLAGTYGTEFWMTFLSNNGADPTTDKTLKVSFYAVSESPVTIRATRGANSLGTFTDVSGGGQQYFYKLEGLDPVALCPTPDESESKSQRGICISAADGKTKFSCYAITEVGGTSANSMRDATLLLPKDILGKEYFVQVYPDDGKSTEFAVVATEDKTQVTIVPSCVTYSNNQAGSAISVTLNKGESYLVKSQLKKTDSDIIDLSGSTVCADKPIAVFNGNEATKIPNSGAYSANHTFEQAIPQTMWGTAFYVGRVGGTLRNRIQITASYDGTEVTYVRASSTQTVTLNRGQSLTNIIQLADANPSVAITSSMPVVCYMYMGCGANNQSTETDPDTGDEVTYDWGNPANALVVPWSHRTKEMSFYTAPIENQSADDKQKFYVQVVTDKADIGKIKLDNTTIPAASYSNIAGNANKVFANVEIVAHGKHHLSSTGSGFTGFVHGMTSAARAYQYTLGFDPPKYLDSLFITNNEQLMSSKSYTLPYMDNKGWYQRQPIDFPIDQQRIDTAYVCDSTVVNFFGQLAEQNKTDEVIWKIYKCDRTGKKIEPAIKEFKSTANGSIKHNYSYQFIVDPQKNLSPDKRDPFTYYAVDMEKYKKHLICTDLPDDADTLRTMVRVQRQYNDTTWRIVCETDTVHFFKHSDRMVGSGLNEETTFRFNYKGSDTKTVAFKKGDNTWTRRYMSMNGCDSIVTLKLYGCDTVYHRLDTTVCESGLKTMIIKDGNYSDRFFGTKFKTLSQTELLTLARENKMQPYDSIYRNARLTRTCGNDDLKLYLDHGCKYNGCPDTFDLHLTIMPLLYYPTDKPQTLAWCVGTDATETYDEWKRADGTVIKKITQTDEAFNVGAHMGVGYFADTVWYNPCPECSDGKCPKEINLLHLRKVDSKPVIDTVHICQNETYRHVAFMAKDRKDYVGWDLPLGQQPDETHQVDVRIDNVKQCEYTLTLRLFVHPAYVKDGSHDTEIKETKTTCIAKTPSDHFEWDNHFNHQVWSVTERKRVNASNISTQTAGTFIYIDSLKTLTCTECGKDSKSACDSICRLTLIVSPEKHFKDSFDLCRNKMLEYKWEGTSYYFYGEEYKGDKRGVPNSMELKNSDYLNDDCKGTKCYEQVFKGLTKYGCDSTRTLKIRLLKTFVTTVDTFICETQTYTFFGESKKWDYVPGGENMYTLSKTVPSQCGCDSGVTHYVYVRPVYADLRDQPDTTCQVNADDAFYTWLNHPRTDEPARDIWMINTKTNEKQKVKTNAIPLKTAGTFTLIDSLKTKTCPKCQDNGCDSITSISLTIIPTYHNKYNYQLSSEGYWLWDDTLFVGGPKAVVQSGITYSEKIVVPGTDCYTHTRHHTSVDALGHVVGTHRSCDSIVTWCIKVGEVFRDTAYAPVCENCSYTWTMTDKNSGNTKTIVINDVPAAGETKWYYDSLKTSMGFDSIYNLQLTGFPTKYATATNEVCQGDEFEWLGHPGQRGELYIVKGGIATPISANNFIRTISKEYGTYLIRDSMVTDTVFYNPGTKLYEPVHCDSIWELTLTVNPTFTERYNYDKVKFEASMCSNETLLWQHRLFVGFDYDEAAHPIDKPSNLTPYDSVLYLPRTANLQFYDSVAEQTGTWNHGCDSINYVTIHISVYDTTWLKPHIGDNNTNWYFGGHGGTFRYNNKDRVTREDLVPSASVDYSDANRSEIHRFFFIDTLQSVLTGCDSIVWDSVYIHPSYRFTFDTLLCSNNDWSWRPESPNADKFKNINTLVTDVYYDSLFAGPYHIDSVYVLNLTIQPGAKHYFGRNMCKNDTIEWELQKIFYEENKGDIEVKYKTGSECDSVLIFKPTFYNFYHYNVETIESDSICRYDTLIWVSPGETTPHTAALRGEKGEHFDYLPTDTVGWITIYDSLHTTAPCHCDSTYTLRYYVKPSYRFYDTATICSNDTLEWRGQILYSDTATVLHTKDSYATLNGSCDSIYYLTLYVNQAYDSVRYDTICGNTERFEWEGHDLSAWLQTHLPDTLPSDTFLLTRYDTQLECDSVFKLYLNVRPILTEEWRDTICTGESYALNDKIFTTSGIYRDTLTNSFGCDSFAVVHLAVVPPTRFTIDPAIVCADNGAYDLVFAFDTESGFQPRQVSIVYDSLAKACGYPEDTVVLPVVGNMVEMELPVTDEDYVRPNYYSAVIYFDNGTCDDRELQRTDFHFTVNYPSWLLEQHWADAIGILSAEYNGGYSFSSYQWYKDGKQLAGETKPYLFAPDYLEVGAEYSVELTRIGDTLGVMSCSIVAAQRDNKLIPQKPYVSVVPTMVVKANPVVHIMCSQFGGEFKLFNPFGSLIQSGRFEPDEHNVYEVRLPSLSGIYMFELNQENGEVRTVKVLVE